MKIGIITFHASDNCGSHLQAYALQQVLAKVYHADVDIINFSNKRQREMYSIFLKIHRFRDVLRNILRILLFPALYSEKKGFRKFWRFYNLTSKSYICSEDMSELDDGRYDVIVCGSDQIWNYKTGDFDYAYLLNFAKKTPKVAYAVSMGQGILEDRTELQSKYQSLLIDFKAISVREFKSQPMIQKISPVPVDICLDPTFLLETNEYDEIMPIQRYINNPYIFCYAFTFHEQFVENVMYLSSKLNLPVYMMDRFQNLAKCAGRSGIKLTPKAGTEAFLNVFKYADVIFTTSFHGTVFSVKFKKTFWYLNENGKGNEGDGRATSLLRQMGLMNRYLTPEELRAKDDLLEGIDFEPVYDKLQVLKNHSLQFIEREIINVKTARDLD